MSDVDLQQVQLTRDELLYRLYTDPRFFIAYFMQEEVEFPVPDFHVVVFLKMISPTSRQYVCAIPRGHAKTTIAKLAVLWLYMFDPVRFIVYVSNTHGVAGECIQDILTFMESPQYATALGAMERVQTDKNNGKYKFRLHWAKYRAGEDGAYSFTLLEKFCILKAQGAGQQVRGLNIDNQRPEIAFVDDLESKEGLESAMGYRKLKSWFFSTFRKALDKRRYRIRMIGNLVAEQSLLNDNIKSQYWDSTRFGCILENGQPLWPDLWPLQDIAQDYEEYKEAGELANWFAEMMNMPMDVENAIIKASDISYIDQLQPGDGYEYGFLTIDPAVSSKTWADDTAIVVHLWTGLEWTIPEYTKETGLKPVDIFNIGHYYSQKYGLRVWGVEHAGYQAALRHMFEYIAETNNLRDYEFYPVPANEATKTQRIATWASLLRQKIYKLKHGEFGIVSQLISYDASSKRNKDDLIDSCAQGVYMIRQYIERVIATTQPTETNFRNLDGER